MPVMNARCDTVCILKIRQFMQHPNCFFSMFLDLQQHKSGVVGFPETQTAARQLVELSAHVDGVVPAPLQGYHVSILSG